MKVLYLFTRPRNAYLKTIKRGEDHGNNFWGMLRLADHGIEATYTELEHYIPAGIAEFLRRHVLKAYWSHAPLFLKFLSYDIIFTSGAYGSQLIHTLLSLRKPKWVMHDFSITGLLGEERTLKQKVFAWLVSRAAGIVTVSKKEQAKLQVRFPHLKDRIAYIPFGIDLAYFASRTAETAREIFIPGTDPDRDYPTAFEAAMDLNTRVVVTTKPDRLAKLKSIPAFVEHRRFSASELMDAYARAAVVVIPLNTKSGLNDAMGLTVLQEALAMGKAIIATRTPTTESYITDGENGLLVEEGNAAALRAALTQVLDDPALRARLEHAARTYAEHYLDADQRTKELAEFFRTIAN